MNASLPRSVKWLLIANVAVFLVDLLTSKTGLGGVVHFYLSLEPWTVLHQGQAWRLVTYMFVHDLNPPFIHLLFNLLMLWMFGVPLAYTMGERRFLGFYFACGLFAGLCSILFYSLTGNNTLVFGASGALFGLMFAFARFFPTQQFLMFFIFPVEARYAVLIIGAIELLLICANDHIAHVTHLGGALFAWLYFRLEDRGLRVWEGWRDRRERRLGRAAAKAQEKLGQAMLDIDPILKKISQHGLQSLTREEREALDRASELRRKQKSKIISWDEYRNRQ